MALIEPGKIPAVNRPTRLSRIDIGRLHRWHMRAGLWIGLAVILWALSGLGHPILSRLNPKPATFAPPLSAVDGSNLQSPQQVLQAAGLTRFEALRLWQPAGATPAYRVQSEGRIYWIDARSGAVQPDAERRWAERLARHYTGDQTSAATRLTLLDSFNNDYHYIDRLLPVWEVALNRPDGLRAYVDPASGRLATLTDTRKDWTGKLFRWMHSWSPIQSSRWTQGIMLTLLLVTAMVSAAGLAIYVRLWRRGALRLARPATVRIHQRLAVPVAPIALMLALSGALHLGVKAWQGDPTAPAAPRSFSTTELQAPFAALVAGFVGGASILALDLTRLDGEPAWIAMPASPVAAPGHRHGDRHDAPPPADRYVNAATGAVIPDGNQRHATALAYQHAGLPIGTATDVKPVHRFGDGYGFVFKRLPVMAVTLPERPGETWYVETRTGALAAHLTPLNRIEGWVFGAIHKWSFLDAGIGKPGRELLQSLAALALALTVGLGLARQVSRWRQSRA
jgi:hypothetical protein